MKFLLLRTLISIILMSFVPLLANPISNNPVYEVSRDFDKQLVCMAKNIYYEAATEPYEGKLAVAQVVMNRTRSGHFPRNVCDVVYQKDQFSWVAENHSNETNKYAWEECVMIARKALTEVKLHDIIYKTKAMYFHNTSVHPVWNIKYVAKIGNHLFYTKT